MEEEGREEEKRERRHGRGGRGEEGRGEEREEGGGEKRAVKGEFVGGRSQVGGELCCHSLLDQRTSGSSSGWAKPVSSPDRPIQQ
jgi:hypothetical protein